MIASRIARHRPSAYSFGLLAATSCVFAGVAVVAGGLPRTLTFVASGIVLLLSIAPLVVRPYFKTGYMVLEVPILLLLVSGLVFRVRDAEALATNPLDSAAMFRVACVATALLLGGLALTAPSRDSAEDGMVHRSRPFRLFAAYIVVVFIGTAFSVQPLNTAYRGVELGTGWLVLAGARRALGSSAFPRIETTLYWFTVLIAGCIWLNVIIFGGEALTSTMGSSPLPWQLVSVVPSISANGVGAVGAILALWSLAYRFTPDRSYGPRPRMAMALAAAGFLMLIAAQYRTGYVAAVVGIVVLLIIRKRTVLAAVVLGGLLVAVVWGSAFLSEASPFVLRGQTPQEAAELSGRLDWWEEAIPVWKESPLVGKGLLSATRFEVLDRLGEESTSTIHGTWIEALVGTGLFGVGLLAASLLITWRRALAETFSPNGRLVPILILTILTVQSFTSTTIEVFGWGTLYFLAVAMSLTDSHFDRRFPQNV